MFTWGKKKDFLCKIRLCGTNVKYSCIYTYTSQVFIPVLHKCNSARALTWKNTFPRINMESAFS